MTNDQVERFLPESSCLGDVQHLQDDAPPLHGTLANAIESDASFGGEPRDCLWMVCPWRCEQGYPRPVGRKRCPAGALRAVRGGITTWIKTAELDNISWEHSQQGACHSWLDAQVSGVPTLEPNAVHSSRRGCVPAVDGFGL